MPSQSGRVGVLCDRDLALVLDCTPSIDAGGKFVPPTETRFEYARSFKGAR